MWFALCSLLGITIGTIFQKKYCTHIALTSNLLIQYLVSSIIVSVIGLMIGKLSVVWTVGFIVSLFWIVFVISLAGTYLFYSLIKTGKATTVSSYLYCVPPVTAVLDRIVFHTEISAVTFSGMVLVMISVVMLHVFSNARLVTHKKIADKERACDISCSTER